MPALISIGVIWVPTVTHLRHVSRPLAAEEETSLTSVSPLRFARVAAAPRAKVLGLGPLGGLAPIVPWGLAPWCQACGVRFTGALCSGQWDEGCQALEGTEATWGHCFWLKLGGPFGPTVPFAQP